VSDSGNVCGYLDPVREPYPCNLSQCGVRLFRCKGHDTCAHTSPLGTLMQGGRRRFILQLFSPLPDELIHCRHTHFSPREVVRIYYFFYGVSIILFHLDAGEDENTRAFKIPRPRPLHGQSRSCPQLFPLSQREAPCRRAPPCRAPHSYRS